MQILRSWTVIYHTHASRLIGTNAIIYHVDECELSISSDQFQFVKNS